MAIFIGKNSYENVICKKSAILSWPQCVKDDWLWLNKSQQNFAYTKTVVDVQNFIVIEWVEEKISINVFWSNLKFNRNFVIVTGIRDGISQGHLTTWKAAWDEQNPEVPQTQDHKSLV